MASELSINANNFMGNAPQTQNLPSGTRPVGINFASKYESSKINIHVVNISPEALVCAEERQLIVENDKRAWRCLDPSNLDEEALQLIANEDLDANLKPQPELEEPSLAGKRSSSEVEQPAESVSNKRFRNNSFNDPFNNNLHNNNNNNVNFGSHPNQPQVYNNNNHHQSSNNNDDDDLQRALAASMAGTGPTTNSSSIMSEDEQLRRVLELSRQSSAGPSPVDVTNARTQYQGELMQLHQMGLMDDDQNIAALIATHGDVNRAIERLFS